MLQRFDLLLNPAKLRVDRGGPIGAGKDYIVLGLGTKNARDLGDKDDTNDNRGDDHANGQKQGDLGLDRF